MDASQFVFAVLELIRGNVSSANSGGLSAAQLGLIVRQAFPGLDWKAFGFPKLKDVLRELESAGHIRLSPAAAGALSIWLTNAATPQSLNVSLPVRPLGPSRLRQEIWFAFVSETPKGRRFLHKKTGEVRLALTDAPSDGEWFEIFPVSQEAQRDWAREYLASTAKDIEPFKGDLVADDWYRRFAVHLSEISKDDIVAWNRDRTQRVLDVARTWCEERDLPFAIALEQRRQATVAVPVTAGAEDRLRKALLAAVHQMETSDLLEISIKAKYLVRVLRPELTDGFTPDGAEA